MNKFHWLGALVFCFVGLVVALFLTEVPVQATGMMHPHFSSMLKSGSNLPPSLLQKIIYLFVGIFILTILCLMLFIGIDNRKSSSLRLTRLLILIASGLYISVFVVMVLINWSYVDGQSDLFVGGFPLPTAIMLYVLTLFPLTFSLIYILKFKSWILNKDDLTKFEEIIRSRKQRQSSNPGNDGGL